MPTRRRRTPSWSSRSASASRRSSSFPRPAPLGLASHIMEAEMTVNLEPLWARGAAQLSERLRGLIERGREARALDYQRALRSLPPMVKRSTSSSSSATTRFSPHPRSHGTQGLGRHGRPRLLRAVDAARHAGGDAAPHARGQRPAARGAARGTAQFRWPLAAHARWLNAKLS